MPFAQEVIYWPKNQATNILVIGDEREFFAGEGIYSFASTVMNLSGEPELHMSFTPADPSSYTRLGFAGRAAS